MPPNVLQQQQQGMSNICLQMEASRHLCCKGLAMDDPERLLGSCSFLQRGVHEGLSCSYAFHGVVSSCKRAGGQVVRLSLALLFLPTSSDTKSLLSVKRLHICSGSRRDCSKGLRRHRRLLRDLQQNPQGRQQGHKVRQQSVGGRLHNKSLMQLPQASVA